MTELALPLGVLAGIFAAFGLAIGSFLNVLIARVPARESLMPRSRCPRCGTQIPARDNIPVVSWLLLRGRCRACGERISIQYPLVELATAALFAGAAATFDRVFVAAVVAVFLAVMLVLGIIDARHRVVPNVITYPALLLFLVALTAGDLLGGGVDVLDGLIGLAAYGIPVLALALAIPGGMGGGDAKLSAVIGLVLGSLGLRYVAVAAGLGILAGGVGAIVAMIVLRYGRKQTIPFGPYLAAGAIASAFVGRQVADAYLSLLT